MWPHPLHQPAGDHFDQRASRCVATGWTADARAGGPACCIRHPSAAAAAGGRAGADEVQVAGQECRMAARLPDRDPRRGRGGPRRRRHSVRAVTCVPLRVRTTGVV
jgi:hypothetical protein